MVWRCQKMRIIHAIFLYPNIYSFPPFYHSSPSFKSFHHWQTQFLPLWKLTFSLRSTELLQYRKPKELYWSQRIWKFQWGTGSGVRQGSSRGKGKITPLFVYKHTLSRNTGTGGLANNTQLWHFSLRPLLILTLKQFSPT